MLSHISLEYERFFKTVFEKVFANVWVIFTARPQRDLCILPLVKGLDLERWRTQWASHGQASISTTTVTVASAVAVPHSHSHGEAKYSGMWMQKHGLNYLSFAKQKFAFQHSL